MTYKEFIPGEALKQFVKCYYIFETETDYEDKAFATGCVEIMFNLGSGQIAPDNGFITTPLIELWGQIINPLPFKPIKKNKIVGIRFYPHAASLFLNEDVHLFNNRVTDFSLVAGRSIHELYSKLLEATTLHQQIELIEEFLLNRFRTGEKHLTKINLINKVINELKQEEFFDNIENVSSRYGISSRYLQKIFSQYTGLSPKLYRKINRFQNSLLLIAKKQTSLTSIAYECGYFDQAHFIRDFKSFTGMTPSEYRPENSSAILASSNK